MSRDLLHRAAFESHGETYTRLLAQQGGDVGAEATAWLAEQQALRDESAFSKRDAREEETLSIARRAVAASETANSIAVQARSEACRANTIAITAAILATAATIIAAVIGVMYASPK